ncbi:lipoprotein [Mycobacterium bohemicum DSM 44277]|nr:lipoprotein [Mycobacterium bohemicum DSM 44277]
MPALMRQRPGRFTALYGSHPLHLLTMLAGFALLGYLLATFSPATLWNPETWWQSIAVWLAAAVIAHDLVLFPLYALADRLLFARPGPRAQRRPNISARNHIRVPALAAGLTLLIFLPGIIEQGAPTYLAATGQTQDPFLGRWLLLTAAMFAASALAYGVRVLLERRRARTRP